MKPPPVLLFVCIALQYAAAFEPVKLISTATTQSSNAIASNGDSFGPILSAGGRYVLFASTASNLVTNEAPEGVLKRSGVYVRDLQSGTTTLASVNAHGAGAAGDCVPAAISDDGQFVAFGSDSADLTPGDTNGTWDVFVRNLASNSTVLVSTGTNGVPADGPSRDAAMTPDGRYVVFVSAAHNLVANDTNDIPDVFVRDLVLGQTVLVSESASGGGMNPRSEAPSITPDGRYVVFRSTATNLVQGITRTGQIYVRDLFLSETRCDSQGAAAFFTTPGLTSYLCVNPIISDDGAIVTYQAAAPDGKTSLILSRSGLTGLTELVGTNTAFRGDFIDGSRVLSATPDGRFIAFLGRTNTPDGESSFVMVRDQMAASPVVVSVGTNGATPVRGICRSPRISSDGRVVAFISTAVGLVTNELRGTENLFARDLGTGRTTLLNRDARGSGTLLSGGSETVFNSAGTVAAYEAAEPDGRLNVFMTPVDDGAEPILVSQAVAGQVSASASGGTFLSYARSTSDGRWVGFASPASDLVPGDTNQCWDVFVRDVETGATVMASVSPEGLPGNRSSNIPFLSADGASVVFSSFATNLVAGDTNDAADLFKRDLALNQTYLLSTNFSGGAANGDSHPLALSTDHRYLLFTSAARNLLNQPTSRLFLRDMEAGTNLTLPCAPWMEDDAVMTPDGKYVLFPTSSVGAASLFDTLQQKAVLTFSDARPPYSISADGARVASWKKVANAMVVSDRASGASMMVTNVLVLATNHRSAALTMDGRYLALTAKSRTGKFTQVFLHEVETGVTRLLSRKHGTDSEGNGHSDSLMVSPDGRYIAFRSAASDLVPNDTNAEADAFVWDSQSNELASIAAAGIGSGTHPERLSLRFRFGADSRTLFVESWSPHLATGDRNGAADLFAARLEAGTPAEVLRARLVFRIVEGIWTPVIMWPTQAGREYQVEYKNALTDPGWQPLTGGPALNEGSAEQPDPSAEGNSRFYRVLSR